MKLAVSCLFIEKINISTKLFARHSMLISTDFMLNLRQNKKLSACSFLNKLLFHNNIAANNQMAEQLIGEAYVYTTN